MNIKNNFFSLLILDMLLEYVPGGELFSVLRQRGKFDTKTAVFYAAEILCALDYLHNLQIIYRDLKVRLAFLFEKFLKFEKRNF